MIAQQTIDCSKCNKPILFSAWYCCNPEKYYCTSCSSQYCKLCNRNRSNIHKDRRPILKTSPKKKKCTNCSRAEDKYLQEYFQEQKCKEYYCHACLLVFYGNYCKMIANLQKQYGEAPNMDVQLRCGCEIPKQKIVQYAKKYCFCCSDKIDRQALLLKNQCYIMIACYNQLERQSMIRLVDKQKSLEIKQLYYQIRPLLIECDSCKKVIEGEVLKIDQLCLCNFCYQTAKYAERQFSNQQKLKGNRNNEILKNDRIKRQQLKHQKCQLCSKYIYQLQNQEKICKACLKQIDQNIIENLKQRNQQQQQKKPKDSKDQMKQQLKQQEIRKSKQNDKQQKLQPLLESKAIIQNKIQEKQKIPENIKKLHNKLNLIYVQQQIDVAAPNAIDNPKRQNVIDILIDDQFLPVAIFALKCNPKQQKMVQCSQCKCLVIEENTFKSYQRQLSNQSTLRIAQTEQELLKYGKQSMVKVYCKICYLQLKRKIKKEDELKKYQASRYSYSMPKKANKQIKSPFQFKINLNQKNNYPLPPREERKQDANLIQKNNSRMIGFRTQSSFLQKLQKEKERERDREKLLECPQCKKLVLKSEFSIKYKICTNCSYNKLDKEKDEYIKIICYNCKRLHTVKQIQIGRFGYYCTNCFKFTNP